MWSLGKTLASQTGWLTRTRAHAPPPAYSHQPVRGFRVPPRPYVSRRLVCRAGDAGRLEAGSRWPELLSSPSTRSALRLPPPPRCAPWTGPDSEFPGDAALATSARSWWRLCLELRKKCAVGSSDGPSRICSEEAPPTSDSGRGTGRGATSGRLPHLVIPRTQ